MCGYELGAHQETANVNVVFTRGPWLWGNLYLQFPAPFNSSSKTAPLRPLCCPALFGSPAKQHMFYPEDVAMYQPSKPLDIYCK